jgi:hypothetical protein
MNKRNIALIFCFFSFLLTTQAAVWYVATNGNDNNAGDLAHPFKTLPAAIEAANPGDEIQLRGGNYYENINGLVMNNLITNTQHAGIGLWGAKDARVYNNTVINGPMSEMACLFLNTADVWLDDNNSARPGNTNIQIKNNIFVQGTGNTPMVRVRENALAGNTNVIDNNCYFRPSGSIFVDDHITWEDLRNCTCIAPQILNQTYA